MAAQPASEISRRTALKGVGVGAAATWAAPTVLSLGSSALAASAVCEGGGGCNGPYPICGLTGPNGFCFCMATEDGGQFCSESRACPDQSECATDDDCAAGWKCGATCFLLCDLLLCNPPCGSNLPGPDTTGQQSGRS
jgi:hypothetical protein